MEYEEVLGVIFALPREVIDYMFKHEKDVFVKYITHVPSKKTKTRIKEGIKLFVYESRNKKQIVGEAIIKKIEYLVAKEIIEQYSDRLITNLETFQEYTKDRKDKPLLVLKLDKIREYKIPRTLNFAINMGGLYITKKNKEIIELKK